MSDKDSLEYIRDVAARLAVVAEEGNLGEIAKFYAPDAILWTNTTGHTRKIADHLASVPNLRANIEKRKWVDLRINAFPGGYVQQWRISAELPDGATRYMPICMICAVKDGLISRREDYFDSVHLAALRSQS
jgi:limonene-1,2-epoxide hydrolase